MRILDFSILLSCICCCLYCICLFLGRFFYSGDEGMRFIMFSVTLETYYLPLLEGSGERFYDYSGMRDEGC